MSDETRNIQAQLEAPFDPAEVDFRPADRGNQVVAFIDGEAVIRRLNAVFGPDGWSFDWDALVISPGQARKPGGEPPPHDVVWVVKGRLLIGSTLHADLGDADANETSKAAVTDALKRCATQIGIGLYLRSLPRMTATIKDYVIPDEEKARLRKGLPKPPGHQEPAADLATPQQVSQIRGLTVPAGKTVDTLCGELRVATLGNLTSERADKVIARLQDLARERAAGSAA